jgi:hypothetical protein
MSYHPLTSETGSDADNRRSEANRILEMLKGRDEELAPNEQKFFENLRKGYPVTAKQLFWLRDIKDRII